MATDGPVEPEGGSPASRRNPPAEPVSIAAAPGPRASQAQPRSLLTGFLGCAPLSAGSAQSPGAAGAFLLEGRKASHTGLSSPEAVAPSPGGNFYPLLDFQAVDVSKSQAPRSRSQSVSAGGALDGAHAFMEL